MPSAHIHTNMLFYEKANNHQPTTNYGHSFNYSYKDDMTAEQACKYDSELASTIWLKT